MCTEKFYTQKLNEFHMKSHGGITLMCLRANLIRKQCMQTDLIVN